MTYRHVLCGSQTTKIGVGGGVFTDVKPQLLCHMETNARLYEVIYKYPLRFKMIRLKNSNHQVNTVFTWLNIHTMNGGKKSLALSNSHPDS